VQFLKARSIFLVRRYYGPFFIIYDNYAVLALYNNRKFYYQFTTTGVDLRKPKTHLSYNQPLLEKLMKLFISIVLLAVLLPTISSGEDKPQHEEHGNASGVEALSDDLRDLLSQEMQALEGGMISIIPAYNSGSWSEIATTAEKMNKSYIMKQKLTEPQIKELHARLPHSFIEKDQRFHYLAGMLEHAAKNKKAELINFYFSEMNESCVSCHTKFATHRFPKLLSKEKKEEHTQKP
jgi:hypothetical protein